MTLPRRAVLLAGIALLAAGPAAAQVTGTNQRFEITATTTASGEAVYRLWSDPATWTSWDALVDRASLSGAGVGARGKLKGKSGPESTITVTVAEPGRRFAYAATGPGVRILYEREYVAGSPARITHRVTFSGLVGGALAGGNLGRQFREGLPAQMNRIKALAERG